MSHAKKFLRCLKLLIPFKMNVLRNEKILVFIARVKKGNIGELI